MFSYINYIIFKLADTIFVDFLSITRMNDELLFADLDTSENRDFRRDLQFTLREN